MNFGDLRSAVHAERGREQRVKEVLATYEGDPYQALSYVRDNGALNIVSGWVGENDALLINRADSSLWRLGSNVVGPARWDTGPLRGFVNIGAQTIELIHVKHDPRLHQSWAMENVRLPALDMWRQFLNGQTFGLRDARLSGRASHLIGGMLGVHHPAFIAGKIDENEWSQRGEELADVLDDLADVLDDLADVLDDLADVLDDLQAPWRFQVVFGADSAWHATTAFARISTKNAKEQRIAESSRLESHHGAWLIDRFGWNALEVS